MELRYEADGASGGCLGELPRMVDVVSMEDWDLLDGASFIARPRGRRQGAAPPL
jgi:hypothetical protein